MYIEEEHSYLKPVTVGLQPVTMHIYVLWHPVWSLNSCYKKAKSSKPNSVMVII